MPRTSPGPLLPALVLTGLLAACGSGDASPGGAGSGPTTVAPAGAPALDVQVMADGLDHPWDVVQAPDGTLLVDERAGGFTAVRSAGSQLDVAADLGDLFAEGETGLMGMALSPDFEQDRLLFTCQGVQDGGDGTPEIQVLRWTVAADWTGLERDPQPLVEDIPVNERIGRHGGCRLQFGPDGALFVGTGDTALGTTPQDLSSRAGKVLRVDPGTGGPPPGNPFTGTDGADELVWTYGHRNVQGLAVRPGSGEPYSVEHGPDRDDEVNRLQPGQNHGWDPEAGADGYDESVPMTDPELPDVSAAVWSSGEPTIAPSGGTFLDGAAWQDYDGLLLLGVLRDTGVLGLRLDEEGELVEQFRVPELEDEHGRIRAVRQGADGALYVTTDNGDGQDVLLRVTPR